MKFKGSHITQASGSLAGVTYSHNRGGQYTRARSIPVSPNTPQQAFMKATFGDLASRWSEILTPAQRAGWEAYALNTPLPDALGDPRNVGGIGMYIRGNAPRLQAAMGRIDNGPTSAGLPGLTAPGVTSLVAATGILTYTFTNTDTWAAAGGALLVYASRGYGVSINGFKGPFRFVDATLGAGVPPTSPQTVAITTFTYVAGQRVFIRFQAVDALGRLSPQYLIPVIVT